MCTGSRYSENESAVIFDYVSSEMADIESALVGLKVVNKPYFFNNDPENFPDGRFTVENYFACVRNVTR